MPSNTTNILEENVINNRNLNQRIKIVSLNSFCIENQIKKVDFLKIDVEGEEYSILKNSNNFLNKFKPLIYLEIHNNLKNNSIDLIKYLIKNNYTIYLVQTSDNNKIFQDFFDNKNNLSQNLFFLKIDIYNESMLYNLKKLNAFHILATHKESELKIDIRKIN